MIAGRSAPRLLAGFLGVAVAGAAGLCGLVVAAGLALSWPVRSVVGPPPEGLTALEIPSPSGARLRAWWLPPAAPGGGVVVLMHGVRTNRTSLVARAQVLRAEGFGVLLFDFQAHGETVGNRITFGQREAMDAEAAVAFARTAQPTERVGAIGLSMGGAAALLGTRPLDVDALVLESVYPTIDAALANRLRERLGGVLGPVIVPVLTPLFMTLLPPILGATPAQLRPIDHIGAIKAPLLLASGTADERTPIKEARALFDRAPEPKTFWAVPGAAHVDLERFDPEGYWRTVLPFLTAAVRAPGPSAGRSR